MRRNLLTLFALFLVLGCGSGCDGLIAPPKTPAGTSVAAVPPSQPKPTAVAPTQDPSTSPTASSKRTLPFQEPVPQASATDPVDPVDPDDHDAKIQPDKLPEIPRAVARSTLVELNKEKTLYVEKLPGGSKRILFIAEVCLRRGPLEVFLCKSMTKEHEAILKTNIDARYLHAALVAIGAEKGQPVQFVNPKTDEPEYKPARGQEIRVSVAYNRNGDRYEHLAQEWILDLKTKQPMKHNWVFAGSRFTKNPDAPPEAPDYYAANNGEVIAISNFTDSMLDIPVEISKDVSSLQFEAITAKIPGLKTQVWVILEPVTKK